MKNIEIILFYETDKEINITTSSDYEVILPINFNMARGGKDSIGNFEMFSSISEQIPPFTKCKITIEENTTYWYCNSVSSNFNKNKGIYKHDVYLIEPVKILERHILGARAFSSGSSYFTTNKELVELILNTCYTYLEEDENPIGNLVLDTKNNPRLNEVAKEYFFPETTTLKEALDQIALSVNCELLMSDFNTIFFEPFDKEEEYIVNNDKVFHKQISEEIDSYSIAVESYASNVLNTTNSTYSLTDNYGISMRSEVARITQETANIILEKPIYRIKSVKLLPNEGLRANRAGSSTSVYPIAPLDITKRISGLQTINYIIEKSQWDLLDETEQNKRLYYTSGDNKLENSLGYIKHWGIFNSNLVIKNIINEILLEQSNAGLEVYGFSDVTGLFYDKNDINRFIDLEYVVEYESLDNVKIKAYKNRFEVDKTDNNNLIYNQSSNITDIKKYVENLQATIKRLGNESMELSIIDDINNLPATGQKIGDYYINEIHLEVYNKYNKMKLILSKFHNRLEKEVSLDSQLRLFNIPDDNFVVDRNVYLESFVFLTKDKPTYENMGISDGIFYTSPHNGTKSIKNALTNDEYDYNENNPYNKPSVLIRTRIEGNPTITEQRKPINAFTIDNSILFTYGFNDNSLAGFKNDNRKSKALLYTNNDGEVNSLHIDILVYKNDYTDITGDKAKALPENNMAVWDITKRIYQNGYFNLKKDKREILKFNQQIHFLSDTPDLIIVNAFSKHTNLFTLNPVPYQLTSGGSFNQDRNAIRIIAFYTDKQSNNLTNIGKPIFKVLYTSQGINYYGAEVENIEGTTASEYVSLINGESYYSSDASGVSFKIVEPTELNGYEQAINVIIPEALKQQYQSFIIADENGDVILICNDINTEKIYFDFSKTYNK